MLAAAVRIVAVPKGNIGTVILRDDRLAGVREKPGGLTAFSRPFVGLVFEVLGIGNDHNWQKAVLRRQTAPPPRTGRGEWIERKRRISHRLNVLFGSILHKGECASQHSPLARAPKAAGCAWQPQCAGAGFGMMSEVVDDGLHSSHRIHGGVFLGV